MKVHVTKLFDLASFMTEDATLPPGVDAAEDTAAVAPHKRRNESLLHVRCQCSKAAPTCACIADYKLLEPLYSSDASLLGLHLYKVCRLPAWLDKS